ncbi:MAG TPA: sigma 54-interacting transcriptional regulator [Candidatus Binataceae bacterium]|nr:sigma 54-interacting transcriptional regulator [Candidatus Binataceae bacterium]
MESQALQALALRVGEATTIADVFQRIVTGLAAQHDVALARVWLNLPGDICDSCPMRQDCPGRVRCLHLVASAGNPASSQEDWSRLDGDFRRIPLNVRKVGEIGARGEPILVGRDLVSSRWVARPDWALREGIVSFAGQPLIFRGEILGALGVFRRSATTASECDWLRIFADHAAIAIANARAFEEIARLRRQLEMERDFLREEVKEVLAFGNIVGASVALRGVLEQVQMVAPTDAAVLILGESGTGKELVAAAIHERSMRRERPFVRVNCGAIPSELFESEFFGHVKGSFTGALRDRVGRFQYADGGTLFLDEISEIPPAHQPKLLRVLQDGQFQRIGDDATRKVNVRIIAASNRDLKQEVAAQRFRQDLYYRLSVFPLEIPPLRERLADIPALANHIVSLLRNRLDRPDVRFTNDDAELLKSYDWPGNVRELQNVIERAMILAKGTRLRLDLALAHSKPTPSLSIDGGKGPPAEPASAKILRSEDLKQLERDNIVAALERSNWKISGRGGAAEMLGFNPSTLASRIRSLGITRNSR